MKTFALRVGMQSCPGHPDRVASLHVTHSADGRWLLKCHAGCTQDEVRRAAGLTWAELFPPDSPPPLVAQRHAVKVNGVDSAILAPMVAEADRTRRRLSPWWPILYRSDEVRAMRQAAQDARDLMPKYPAIAWDLLDQAVHLDTQADDLEVKLDALTDRLMRHGAA